MFRIPGIILRVSRDTCRLVILREWNISLDAGNLCWVTYLDLRLCRCFVTDTWCVLRIYISGVRWIGCFCRWCIDSSTKRRDFFRGWNFGGARHRRRLQLSRSAIRGCCTIGGCGRRRGCGLSLFFTLLLFGTQKGLQCGAERFVRLAQIGRDGGMRAYGASLGERSLACRTLVRMQRKYNTESLTDAYNVHRSLGRSTVSGRRSRQAYCTWRIAA